MMSAPASSTSEPFPGEALARRYGSGFGVLELRQQRVSSCAAFASSHPDAGHSLNTDSIMWLGCLSKPITATAAMILVDRGELALDDRLDRFMPTADGAVGAITVRRLLTHTAGLPRNVPESASFFCPQWLAEPLQSAAGRTAARIDRPEGRAYSSVGFMFLGSIVERVASLEFGSFVAREIFAPLGMFDSYCINAIPPEKAARVAPVFVKSGSDVKVAFVPGRERISNSMPYAGFFSTTQDFGQFMQMVLAGGVGNGRSLLSEQAVRHMGREAVFGQGIHQGMGWFLGFRSIGTGPTEAPCGFWHTSSSGSIVAGDPESDAAIVILGQTLLQDELVPLRVAEWRYIERTMQLHPLPPGTNPATDVVREMRR